MTEAVCKSLLFSPLAVKDLIVKPLMEANTYTYQLFPLDAYLLPAFLSRLCGCKVSPCLLLTFVYTCKGAKITVSYSLAVVEAMGVKAHRVFGYHI